MSTKLYKRFKGDNVLWRETERNEAKIESVFHLRSVAAYRSGGEA